MYFDGAFASAMLSPRKQRKAQIDHCGIESINCSLEIHRQRLMGIKHTGPIDQNHGDIAIDLPVALFVGLGQGGTRDFCLHACVIKLGANSTKACLDVAQTLATGQLSKTHAIKLIETGKGSDAMIALIAIDARFEVPTW